MAASSTLHAPCAVDMEINRAIDTFLAAMSHEMRTPLNGMIGLASLLKNACATREQQWLAEMILKAGESLQSIIDNILDYAKAEAGLAVAQPAVFDMEALLCETLAPFAAQAYGKGLEFACRLRPDVPPRLLGDDRHIRRILSNLVSNALKFTDAGHITVECVVDRRDGASMDLRVTVNDTGRGVAPENLDSIFERFVQEDSRVSRRYGGTRLGLALSRELTRLLGGRIWAESSMEKGSRFHCVIPLREAPDQSPRQVSIPSPPPRVLLVSSEQCVNTPVLCDYLTYWKIPFHHIHNSMAIHALKRNFNAIVLGDEIAVGKDQAFFIELLDCFGAGRVIVLFNPMRSLLSCPTPIPKEVLLLDKPVRPAAFLEMLANCGQSSPGSAAVERAAAVCQPGLASLRVLVAEDNHINQIFVRRALQQKGASVVIAANGIEALRLLRERDFDVVLMDIQMPEMDGFEATRRLREDPRVRNPMIPVIALTASTASREWQECRKAGMDGFIAKPITADQLAAKIAAIVTSTRPGLPAGEPTAAQSTDDYTATLAALGGDRELFEELVAIVLERWPALIKQLQDQSRDPAAVAKTLHTIKGSVNVFGSADFAPRIGAWMEEARAGRTVDIDTCVSFLREQQRRLESLRERNKAALVSGNSGNEASFTSKTSALNVAGQPRPGRAAEY